MFGFGKKKKHFEAVGDELLSILEILQIDKVNNIKKIFDELHPDPKDEFDFHKIVVGALTQVLDEDADLIYK